MTVSELALIIALVLNIALGIGVFFNHPRRATNQFFFALATVTALWLLATWTILHAGKPEVAILSIKLASALAASIPLFCHLIRMTITNNDETGWSIIRQAGYFMLA